MQRLARLEIKSENLSLIELLSNYQQLEKILLRYLPFSTVSIFARPVLQDNVVEWYTELQGQPKLLDPKVEVDQKKLAEITPYLKDRLSQIRLLTKDLNQKGLIDPHQSKQLEKLLETATNSNVQIYLINNEPVITGWGEKQKTALIPTLPHKRKLTWLWWLLPLLFLLLAGLLFWWYLQRSETEQSPELPKIEQVKEEPAVINKEPEVEVPKEELPPVEPQKVCHQRITPAEAPQMAVIFNNGPAMLYTIKETTKKIAAFNERFGSATNSEIQYMSRKPNRSGASKIALNKIIDSIDPNINIGLVELKSCLSSSPKSSAAVSHGIFSSAQRSKLQQKINKMSVRAHKVPGIPLYEGLQKALKMVDGIERDAFILLITEGNGDCTRRDQCILIAKEIQKRPKLKINIVSINSLSNETDCLALATGGQIFNTEVSSEKELTDMINSAVKGMQSEEICE